MNLCNTFTMLSQFPAKNPKYYFFCFFSNENLFPAQSSFPVTLICCITFGSASSACCLLKSLAYNNFLNKHNPEDNWLCHHLLDLSEFFE